MPWPFRSHDRTSPAVSRHRRTRRALPSLDTLEERQLMTVTNHGGGVLSKAEVQGLFFGSDWTSNATYNSQSQTLNRFLGDVVSGPYMDMLSAAGYNVGRGTATASAYDTSMIDRTQTLTDTQVQALITRDISNATLAFPDRNRLYVVYVEDNVVVNDGRYNQSNDPSPNGMTGYHGAYLYRSGLTSSSVHYAVVAYPGGSVNNNQASWFNAVDNLTSVTSREIAGAVTDPNIHYTGQPSKGWYDDTANGEVGDVVAGRSVYLDGYAVQRIADQNDMPMTPAGAQPGYAMSFGLDVNGNLSQVYTNGVGSFLASGVASVSDQSIDDHGHAMVDVVYKNGTAAEYHVGTGFTNLASGVKDAKAGQGVSYVLFTGGVLREYVDATGSWRGVTFVTDVVTAIDAGTDAIGDNRVAVMDGTGLGVELGDGGSYHYFGLNIRSLSIGLRGFSAYIDTSNNAYIYTDGWAGPQFVRSNVSQITVSAPNFIDLIGSGALWDYNPVYGVWRVLATGVASIDKQTTSGVLNYITTYGQAWQLVTVNSGYLAYLGEHMATVA